MVRRQSIELIDKAIADCADEPIRIPGAIQPHGVLLGLREPDLTVLVASDNARALFGHDVMGAVVEDFLTPSVARSLREMSGTVAALESWQARVGEADVDVIMHRAGGLFITEWEPLGDARQAAAGWHRRLPQTLQHLSEAETLDGLVASLAIDVRALTGFDRVMVYRFDPQWNGEVIAEACRDGLTSLMGLHYPASDIPAQARELYVHNWLRLIPNCTYQPVPLTPNFNPQDGLSLDLSGSVLRSVSPVHLEYLANMGVKSSMSISLLDRGRLWGLIACHHYQDPHRPSYYDRLVAEFLGRNASVLLASKTEAQSSARILQVAARQTRLHQALALTPRTPAAALSAPAAGVLSLLPAAGAAIHLDGLLTLCGETPSSERVSLLVAGLLASGEIASDHLSRDLPEAKDVTDTASGLLAVPIGTGGDFLAWFRPEALREVHWAGDPNELKAVGEGNALRLSPRESFAKWSETVRGAAVPWQPHEIEAAQALAGHLREAAQQRTEQDGRLALTLRRTLLLEQLPNIPGVVLAAHYIPADHDVVGGDWYDLVLLPGGKVAMVLGDVAGHGLTAAAITAQIRHGLRAYLLRDDGPGAALAALNKLVTTLLPGELATAVVAELDPETGIVSIANAGHPPPLLLTTRPAQLINEGRGPALGLSPEAGYEPRQFILQGEDRIVLYSDGLIERRGADLRQDLRRLRTAAEVAIREPKALLASILTSLAPTDADDITMLAIGLQS